MNKYSESLIKQGKLAQYLSKLNMKNTTCAAKIRGKKIKAEDDEYDSHHDPRRFRGQKKNLESPKDTIHTITTSL